MANFSVKMRITYKKGVLDPQGNAIERSAHALGFENVKEVRVGKYVTMKISAEDRESAERQVREMARRFLVNPVIEDFDFDVEEAE